MFNMLSVAAQPITIKLFPNGCPSSNELENIAEGLNEKGYFINVSDPENVGVMGFSAGGHFASLLATSYSPDAVRPNFVVLVYPVISMEYSNSDTRSSLLDMQTNNKAMRQKYSTQNSMHKGVLRTFIVLCNDDSAVPPANSIEFYSALKTCSVPAEMHIFPRGGYGWWKREHFAYGDEFYSMIIR